MHSLELISRIAAIASRVRGLRADCQGMIDTLVEGLDARFGFVCIPDAETGDLVVIAATGLNANEFRRLEIRAPASSIVDVKTHKRPMQVSLSDDPALDFLAAGGNANELISAAVYIPDSPSGTVSIGFGPDGVREDVEATLTTVAALIAQIAARDRSAKQESIELARENRKLMRALRERYEFGGIVGNSREMRQVLDRVEQLARSNATILLRGESGTGKELIAGAIHYNSLRAKRPFVRFGSVGVPNNMIGTELFGSGNGNKPAGEQHRGRYERAEGGSIFIDEISALPADAQAQLSQVLNGREIVREGGAVRVNVRLIAASGGDLEREVETGAFSDELYHRLSAFTIYLPPLRERKSDIMLLAEHFMGRFSREFDKHIRRISTPAIDMLTAYHYPGNVRELENLIRHAVQNCDSQVIHGHHLPPTLQTAEISGTGIGTSLELAVETFERDMIQDALKSSRGNIASAARILGSTERILGYKIKKYKIDTLRFKR